MNYYKFDINSNVLVKLTECGYAIWLDYYRHLPKHANVKLTMDYLKNQADENGYVKFHAWEFMEIFGNSIRFGYEPKFSTEILINKSDCEEHE